MGDREIQPDRFREDTRARSWLHRRERPDIIFAPVRLVCNSPTQTQHRIRELPGSVGRDRPGSREGGRVTHSRIIGLPGAKRERETLSLWPNRLFLLVEASAEA